MIRTEVADRVMTVVLDNPPHNFLDRRLVFELDALMDRLEHDRSVGAVVFASAHPSAFITHYDVGEILAGAEVTPRMPVPLADAAVLAVGGLVRVPGVARLMLRTRIAGLATLARVHRVYLRMNRMDKVFVAALNGFTVAGGAELALACDIRVMADDAKGFGMIEPLLGFNPGGGGGQRVVRAVGPARASEMLLESHVYSPARAAELGLVHRVVPSAGLVAEAQSTAARLARRAPAAVWATKRSVYEGFSRGWRRGLRIDRSSFVWAALQPRTQQAMREFLAQQRELPPEERPSPWADDALLEAWQSGTAADFVGGVTAAEGAGR